MNIFIGTKVRALRYGFVRGTVLDNGVVIASDPRAERITVRFADGETASYSGQGIRDYVTVPPLSESVAVGDIFKSAWGYDQTNIDIFEVTAVTSKMIQLRPIASRRTPGEHSMSESVEPVPGQYTGDPFRRRILAGSAGYVAINSYAIATPWNGRAATATHTH